MFMVGVLYLAFDKTLEEAKKADVSQSNDVSRIVLGTQVSRWVRKCHLR